MDLLRNLLHAAQSIGPGIKRSFVGLLDRPIQTTISVSFIVAIFVILGSSRLYSQHLDEVLIQLSAEAHGIIFDILSFGVLMYWINAATEKRITIRNCLSEIADIKTISSEYSTLMILRNIRKLNRVSVTKINLCHVKLNGVRLDNADLVESELHMVNLEKSTLQGINLSDTRCTGANFNGANMQHARCHRMAGPESGFIGTNLAMADFSAARLMMCDFTEAKMISTTFIDADLSECRFDGASILFCDFRGVRGLNIFSLLTASELKNNKYDKEVARALDTAMAARLKAHSESDSRQGPNFPLQRVI